jgi:Uma2 family endonuclease
MPRDDFERHIEEMPEPKLELLDGRFSVGNGAGNMQLLRHILEGWGAAAALPMAPGELWWQALREGFRAFEPPAPHKRPEVWQAWAAQLSYAPDLAPAGPMLDGKHRSVRESLMMGLFGLAREGHFAHVIGRDVIMRLGENAFTPDVFVVGPERASRLNSHYLDGPADVVMEVLLRGHEAYDQKVKRQRYGAGGVPEYWFVDPYAQTVEFLRWTGQDYQPHPPSSDGSYRPKGFAGISLQPAKLWDGDQGWARSQNPFTLDSPMPRVPRGYAPGGVSWGDLDFAPHPALEPRALSFEEFASWAPEAKFEMIEGKPWIGGSRGSRNVLGMLLRTEGLARAVTVLHPREWVAALMQVEQDRGTEAARRQHWWEIARQAAALLRERFGLRKLVVIGDLVRAVPLNVWSMITLIALDIPKSQSDWDMYQVLHERFRDEPDINLVDYKRASRSEQQAVGSEGVEA